MPIELIAQPHGKFRLGDFLTSSLLDTSWKEFYASVAFVKRSGVKHIMDPLGQFIQRGGVVRMSVGIDAGGTSIEGLRDLANALGGYGKAFVFKNANSSTFHPKVYIFKNDDNAALVVGSGNLTEGGLFTNYEASLLTKLDLTQEADSNLLTQIMTNLETWSTPTKGLCYELNEELIKELGESGDAPTEAKTKGDEKPNQDEQSGAAAKKFSYHGVPSAPKVAKPKIAVAVEAEGAATEDVGEDEEFEIVPPPPVAGQPGKHSVFLMTLQNTDVGVGQTTKGTSRRSPEIFIPLVARDYDPEFWGWPDAFTSDADWSGSKDKDGRGKLDRPGVMVRLGGATFPVHIWYNPDKKDMRIRSEHMRSAGNVGDILYVERSDGYSGFTYYVEVIPGGTNLHADFMKKCDKIVRNSKKLWGYI